MKMKKTMMFVAAMAVASVAIAQTPPPAAPVVTPGAQGGRGPQVPPVDVPWNDAVPPGTADHVARALKESTRHGEWVKIKMADGTDLNSWVVYPERATKAGVVVVIHDIRGMADTPRAVGDQLAQDGFIAIVPDFLSGKGPNGGGTESLGTGVGQAIQGITADDFVARITAALEYGKKLPSSNGKTGVVGFCWGGQKSFLSAISIPTLNAAVVYYGDIPDFAKGPEAVTSHVSKIKAPVIGFYGGNDNRINSTLEVTTAAMKAAGKSFETHIFEGAGHGFMSGQAGAAGANLKAAIASWPLALKFFNAHMK